jgi:phosphatidate cytidylyltransferase
LAADKPGSGSLRLRVLSALVMAPVALAAAWAGGPWFAALIALGGVVAAWEWSRLCHAGAFGPSGVAVVASVLVAIVLAAAARPAPGLAAAVLGAVATFGISRALGEPAPGLTALGTLWVGIPCVALLWLASDPQTGRASVLWVFAVVWATDIGAYAAGKTLGGPRLAPRMSPSKTWTGLAGGVLSAGMVGIVTGLVLNTTTLPLLGVSAALAVVEQFGDLAESVAKRRFGVKDASALIPGHGGLLDRVDGLLAVAPVVALLSLVGGSSVLTWR